MTTLRKRKIFKTGMTALVASIEAPHTSPSVPYPPPGSGPPQGTLSPISPGFAVTGPPSKPPPCIITVAALRFYKQQLISVHPLNIISSYINPLCTLCSIKSLISQPSTTIVFSHHPSDLLHYFKETPTLLVHILNSIATNHPGCQLLVDLVYNHGTSAPHSTIPTCKYPNPPPPPRSPNFDTLRPVVVDGVGDFCDLQS
ncbi:hypothetical protein BGZ63DRAFT_190926 [Mariannaea sp. PMI_226]|nr:hypothetical protein BGZ63DRAFT_190926 [Mariannaea sp. PMI_226]